MPKNTAVRLTESAIMLAFAAILSFIAVIRMPFGGDVTACSMLPILLIAYRYGPKWGFFTAFAFSLLQMLFGLDNLKGATSIWAAVAILLLDYIVAFLALGLGGVFRNVTRSQGAALSAGTLLACAVRYVCHVISGCTVWMGISIPTNDGLLYSLAYNAAYMVPETLITVVGAVCLSRVLDFRSESITRAKAIAHRSLPATAAFIAVMLVAAGTILFDALSVFQQIQTEDGFDITRIGGANWGLLGIVSGCAALVVAVYLFVRRALDKKTAAPAQA